MTFLNLPLKLPSGFTILLSFEAELSKEGEAIPLLIELPIEMGTGNLVKLKDLTSMDFNEINEYMEYIAKSVAHMLERK